MSNQIVTVLIKKVPKGQPFLKDHYCNVSEKKATELINGGYAVEYDPKTKKEIKPDSVKPKK